MSKIDVHHHFYPQAMLDALEEAGGDPSGWYIPPWTVELDRQICEDIGVSKAILSVTAPGPVIKKSSLEAAKLARQCNDAAAAIRDTHPDSYGFFASLPSPLDPDRALEEIRYALDELHADGVTLFTRYSHSPEEECRAESAGGGGGTGDHHHRDDNHYLGHACFAPIWEELSARGAVVFVHPTHPADTGLVNPMLPQPMLDYPHETARAAMDLVVSGTLRRSPGCKIILSHAGGTLPYLVHRAATMLPCMPDAPAAFTREGLLEEARGFYFDTALSSGPPTFAGLVEFAKPGHVLFGSDFPNAPRDAILTFTEMFDRYELQGVGAAESARETALCLLRPENGRMSRTQG